MSILLLPTVAKMENEERTQGYERWFLERVQEAMDEPRPGIPHDDVMAEMDAVIAAAEAGSKRSRHNAQHRMDSSRTSGSGEIVGFIANDNPLAARK